MAGRSPGTMSHASCGRGGSAPFPSRELPGMSFCNHCLTDHAGLCLDEQRRRELLRILQGRSTACPYCGVDGTLCPVLAAPRAGLKGAARECSIAAARPKASAGSVRSLH